MFKSKHDPDGSKLKALLLRDAKLKLPIETFTTEQDPDDTYSKYRDGEFDKSSYRLL